MPDCAEWPESREARLRQADERLGKAQAALERLEASGANSEEIETARHWVKCAFLARYEVYDNLPPGQFYIGVPTPKNGSAEFPFLFLAPGGLVAFLLLCLLLS